MLRNRTLLLEINRKVDKIMSQLDDFKAAVTTELSDAQALLAKLASVVTSAQTVDPQVTDLITQLQASHTAIQAALNPAPATTTAPTAS